MLTYSTAGDIQSSLKKDFQGLSTSQLSDPQEIVVAFKQAEQAELVLVEELRSRNSEGKLRSRNSGGNSRSDVMAVQNCELCR